MSSTKYMKKAIKEVRGKLMKAGKGLPKQAKTTLSNNYQQEIGLTLELESAKRQNYYQGLVGILRWIHKLGRLDILVAVLLLMLSYLAQQTREGRREQIFHIFANLKAYITLKFAFDDSQPKINWSNSFSNCNWWKEF